MPRKKSIQKNIKTNQVSTRSVDMSSRTVNHWISKKTLDEHGSLIIPEGCQYERFLKNPLLFKDHDYDINNAVGVIDEITITDQGVIGRSRFNPRPDSLPPEVAWEPDTYLYLLNVGGLRSFSVGFITLESLKPTLEEKKLYGEGLKEVVTKWELVECSIIGIPSNPETQVLSHRGFSDTLIKYIESGKPLDLPTLQKEWPKPVTISLPPEIRIKSYNKIISETINTLLSSEVAKILTQNKIKFE